VRPVLELVGIRDILTKAYGSTNKKNLSKAALAALQSLRTRETIIANRGVEL
jgi:small subunit ribosomal protein S5